MEEGKIIFEGKSKNGRNFIIRYPKSGDVEKMLLYINALSAEKTYILLQGKEFTLEEEQKFLDESLQNIQENNGVVLLACEGDAVIGITNLAMQIGAASHVGLIGVSIAKDYRGEGIGKVLLELLLTEAEKYIEHLRLITLSVYEENIPARNLYKQLGFQEYGRLPEGLLRIDNYATDLLLYKKIK